MKRYILPLLAAAFILIITLRLTHLMKTSGEPYRQYTLRSTRNLVASVMKAKHFLEQYGESVFPKLDEMKSDQWGIYLYVYRLSDCLCLYHGYNPELVGQRLDTFTDQLGKNLHQLISDQIHNPRNPHGWVHYFWHRPDELFLEWKSSCNQAVTLPDGTKCFVGGGLYGISTELEFARIAVAEAEHLLSTHGAGGIDELLSPASIFFFYGTSVFVAKKDGWSIIDPMLKKRDKRDLKAFKDAAQLSV